MNHLQNEVTKRLRAGSKLLLVIGFLQTITRDPSFACQLKGHKPKREDINGWGNRRESGGQIRETIILVQQAIDFAPFQLESSKITELEDEIDEIAILWRGGGDNQNIRGHDAAVDEAGLTGDQVSQSRRDVANEKENH